MIWPNLLLAMTLTTTQASYRDAAYAWRRQALLCKVDLHTCEYLLTTATTTMTLEALKPPQPTAPDSGHISALGYVVWGVTITTAFIGGIFIGHKL